MTSHPLSKTIHRGQKFGSPDFLVGKTPEMCFLNTFVILRLLPQKSKRNMKMPDRGHICCFLVSATVAPRRWKSLSLYHVPAQSSPRSMLTS